MLSIWTKLIHGPLGLNHVVFFEKSQSNVLYVESVLQSDTTYFSSSDWSILDFLLTDVTNVLKLASKMYASQI